jgi:hypothetical protein
MTKPNNEAIPEEMLNRLRAAHPASVDLTVLTAPSGESVVVRNVTRAEWNRFRTKTAADDRKRFDLSEQLLFSCIVHPEKLEVESMLDRRPGLTETWFNGLMDVVGLARDLEKKAL